MSRYDTVSERSHNVAGSTYAGSDALTARCCAVCPRRDAAEQLSDDECRNSIRQSQRVAGDHAGLPSGRLHSECHCNQPQVQQQQDPLPGTAHRCPSKHQPSHAVGRHLAKQVRLQHPAMAALVDLRNRLWSWRHPACCSMLSGRVGGVVLVVEWADMKDVGCMPRMRKRCFCVILLSPSGSVVTIDHKIYTNIAYARVVDAWTAFHCDSLRCVCVI